MIEPSADSRVIARDLQDQFQGFMQSGFTRTEALLLTSSFMAAYFSGGCCDCYEE